MKRIFILTLLVLAHFFSPRGYSNIDNMGTIGYGLSNQLANDLDALSFKVRRSRTSAFGGLLAVSTKEVGGGFGAGLKIYRYLIEEPYLYFYSAAMAAFITQKTAAETNAGFQVDITLGSEFHFPNLESIGFSFEFGLSMNKLDSFAFETVGDHFVTAGVHFYL